MATAIDVTVRENRMVLGKPPPKRSEAAVLLDQLVPGTIMIRDKTPLPDAANVVFKRYGDWRVPQGLNAFGFERRLTAAGWHYFFIVPSARTTRWAFRREAAMKNALDSALRRVAKEAFNSVEIVEIEVKKVFGLYRVRLTTHSRHVKNSPFLREPDPHARLPRIWDFRTIFDKINRDNPQIKAM
jgi:hypothetical protein